MMLLQSLRRLRSVRGALLGFWLLTLALLVFDWHGSNPHRRFDEPPPLALGNGPAPGAGHCSLAPHR